MFGNVWNVIVGWFQDRKDRNRLVRDYNFAAREAFVAGQVPTLLKASISRGERAYKHQFSDWFYSGFRIQAFTGTPLTKSEIVTIGSVVLDNSTLVRRLVVLGFDTLEVHGDTGNYGCRWQLKDHLQLNSTN